MFFHLLYTGTQGGGLVRAALKDGKFKVRALTRNTSSEKAIALKVAGAEVVAFDMDNMESMKEALSGCYGLFVVTNFWEHFTPSKEIQQVKDVVAAGTAAGVEHYIWSRLEDTTKFFDSLPEDKRVPKINGYYVPHFDAKGQADKEFPKGKTTFFDTCFYLENFYNFGMMQNGGLCNNQGDELIPVIGAEDIGKCAYGVFAAGDEYKGKHIGVAGEILTFKAAMEIVSKVTGKTYTYTGVDRDTYAGFGFPGADDMANMFQYQVLNNKEFCGARDVALSKKLNPDIENMEVWANNHKEQLLGVGPKAE